MGMDEFNQQPGNNQMPPQNPNYNQGYNQNPNQGYNQGYNNGYNQGYNQPQLPPDSGMVWAILTTIFCCLPFGIVAIVKASNVSTLWAQGNYDAAMAAAKSSKNWSLAAAISAVVVWIIYFVFFGIAIAAGSFY